MSFSISKACNASFSVILHEKIRQIFLAAAVKRLKSEDVGEEILFLDDDVINNTICGCPLLRLWH